jgi:hypothetical protein
MHVERGSVSYEIKRLGETKFPPTVHFGHWKKIELDARNRLLAVSPGIRLPSFYLVGVPAHAKCDSTNTFKEREEESTGLVLVLATEKFASVHFC